jgi:hypothetical protein
VIHIAAPAAETGGTTDLTGEAFTLGGVILVALIGWLSAVIVKKLREPTRIETLWMRLDKLTTEVYGDGKDNPGLLVRLDATEHRSAAASRVIRDLARQWPSDHVPRLNPDDLSALDEDTVPTHWKVKP